MPRMPVLRFNVADTDAETGQWLDFEPNNRAPGEHYVTPATGRDFLAVSPMRGMILGGARHIVDETPQGR